MKLGPFQNIIRELNKETQRQRQQRQHQKTIGFLSETKTVHMHHAF